METFVCINCKAIVNRQYESPIHDLCFVCHSEMSIEDIQELDIENIKLTGHSNNDYIS